jgi:ATP/ADP translocase
MQSSCSALNVCELQPLLVLLRLQVLFTVVSRDEKYSAKLVIDTVVQRLGDALAAAAFQVLGEWQLLLAMMNLRCIMLEMHCN